MLGGVWSFGSASQGFDSDVAFAVSRTGDVYVWGKRIGPTGLPPDSSLAALTKQTYGRDSDLDSDEEGVREDDAATVINPATRTESSEALKRGSLAPTENIEEEQENANESEEEDEEGGDEDFVHPVKLIALCGEGISHIAVGRVHCCALTKDGDVFTWGQNDHCQLGTEPVHNLSEALSKKARVRYGVDSIEPRLWERTVSETCVVSAVDVGTNHTFAVTDKGEMLAYGATYNTNDHSSLARNLAKLQVHQYFSTIRELTIFVTVVAAGREFTLIATKPYIGPSREEVERRKQEQIQQAESIERLTSVVKDEKRDQLARIRQGKHAAIMAHLNANFPKCTICTTGLICPGFQPNNENPTLCKHCMHENRKHQDQHKAHDRNVTLTYLTQAVEKLGITVDFSGVPDIELEEQIEFELEEDD
ncbi:unnamed protein product [Phytophthora lilii]|uniref:Unnamed protein product n=1 Tax=Phytophthora lilii TaxID=2077276 RepID=A0A9W6WZT9_9STRA|nr:unnamed protein product [Phytophthora lilii]